MEQIRKRNLSAAIFAPGWTYELPYHQWKEGKIITEGPNNGPTNCKGKFANEGPLKARRLSSITTEGENPRTTKAFSPKVPLFS